MKVRATNKAGWWLMEFLLAITIIGALAGAGVMAFVQSANWADGVMARNQAWQADLVRIVMAMQRDARSCARIVATDGWHVGYGNGNPALSSITHGKTASAGGIEMWDLDWPVNLENSQTRSILQGLYGGSPTEPTDASYRDFFTGWMAADSLVKSVTITGGYSSTIIFLKGLTQISAVVYLKVTGNAPNNTVTYSIDRYESNGGRLVLAQSFAYTAAGYTTTADQMNDGNSEAIAVKPDYYDFAVNKITTVTGRAYAIRFPSALSKGLYAMSTGKQASRVKKVPEFYLYLLPQKAEVNMADVPAWLDYWRTQN